MNAESFELGEEPTKHYRTGRVSGVETTRHLPRIEQVERHPGRLLQGAEIRYFKKFLEEDKAHSRNARPLVN